MKDFSHCGVGFITSLNRTYSHETLQKGLLGLRNVEHRGGSSEGGELGDGAGILTTIPYEFLGIDSSHAVASIFAPMDELRYQKSIKVFETTFAQYGLVVDSYREIPINPKALGNLARESMPKMIQAFIKRPHHCRTTTSFDELLYTAKQMVRTNQKIEGIDSEFFFNSLSARTIVYKALATGKQLDEFYLDLQNPAFKVAFAMFHRRFSTNTLPSWDKIQPFRLIAHNGEINTIEGNRSAASSRELALGLPNDQILTGEGASDSGSLNDMIEALKYRSSMPFMKDILSILIPPAGSHASSYFRFWSRAMEPWDGPALVVYCDGKKIGARLDRSGFRPCRWKKTKDYFALCSETGVFNFDAAEVEEQGVLKAGRTVNIHTYKGEIDFLNPSELENNKDFIFDPRLTPLPYQSPTIQKDRYSQMMNLFYYTKEDLSKELHPMIEEGKGAIGSMGDTATLPALSTIHRSIYDYFFQDFAQVTNPPLDYIREKMVTGLKVYLGRKPNIFSPKEMIPPFKAIELDGPIIGHGQMDFLLAQNNVGVIDICFERTQETQEFIDRIDQCADIAVEATQNGKNIIILSDREASFERPPIPSILVMRAVQVKLNKLGIRLKISLIVDSGEIRNDHQIAVLISFGASAVCPYLALDIARYDVKLKFTNDLTPDQRELRLIEALKEGVLKIMAKRGISILRSYQGSELFTIMGISSEILNKLFKKHHLTLGGLNFEKVLCEILERTEETKDGDIPNNFVYKEHAAGKRGEKHSITTKKTKLLHKLLKEEFSGTQSEQWKEFKKSVHSDPINIRDFFELKDDSININKVQTRQDILSLFGSGAMSYGSISAEAQRDIILAMNEVGGRSNSGEGGENPYYFSDGITAKIKQIASGRFGVTTEYLVLADEIQIKMAQGAKPGEGGQLMGIKVEEDIARARFSNEGVDLISPPPHHDIYSIEDLKQLIYELKQVKPNAKVSVKLVSGKNIGAIALGVVKAGADIIHISGGNGGTGAANLMSMKHAGLPWEIGLLEVHQLLTETNMRTNVQLRVDGGLFTGGDVLMGAIYGAEEFDFGKILLVAEGCIMARVCEKNTCPTGIATQNPKFKARYTGRVEEIVRYLQYVAEDVRDLLAHVGVEKLSDLIGRTDLIQIDKNHEDLLKLNNLDVNYFFQNIPSQKFIKSEFQIDFEVNTLNLKILEDLKDSDELTKSYSIKSTDRAVPAMLSGHLATIVAEKRKRLGYKNQDVKQTTNVKLEFSGCAGQGFGIFNMPGVELKLFGEANDSVAKGMSGGKIVIRPYKNSGLKELINVLIGNTCLYGATGGELYLNGIAGDRFAVRNSGANAVVEGVGLHACEYMTAGTVVILGRTLKNIGAGMTGGIIFTLKSNEININEDFIKVEKLERDDKTRLESIIQKHILETESSINTDNLDDFIKLVPNS
jgi:glutamate synthase domain-containing protein 2/glutamate synthase domain-containing protein 1/glutamate synthase domain-containing protein 3